MAMQSRFNLVLGVATCALLAAVGISVTQHGCSGSECTYDQKKSSMPSQSLECPTGDVCYLGQCFRSCNSGAERTTPCNKDSDCKDPGLAHCVLADPISGAFCSTCNEGESCVLGLNVCQTVNDIIDPVPPGNTVFTPPPLPLDGGQIDATTFETDAGEPTAGPLEETHVGALLLEEQVDFKRNDGGIARRPFACVDFADVRSATVAVDEQVILSRGSCDLRQPRLFRSRSNRAAPAGPVNACSRRQSMPQYPTDVRAANIGDVSFSSHSDTPEALTREVQFTFNPGTSRYDVSPANLPEPLMTLSKPRMGMTRSIDRYVRLVGTAEPPVTDPWPGNRDGEQINVPYELKLSATTQSRLRAPIDIEDPPQDLELSWERLPVNTAIPGAHVELNVFTSSEPYVYIHCEVPEDSNTEPRVIIVGEMFSELKQRAGALPPEVPIAIGRTIEKRLNIPGAAPDGGVTNRDAGVQRPFINGKLNISHTYIGTLRF